VPKAYVALRRRLRSGVWIEMAFARGECTMTRIERRWTQRFPGRKVRGRRRDEPISCQGTRAATKSGRRAAFPRHEGYGRMPSGRRQMKDCVSEMLTQPTYIGPDEPNERMHNVRAGPRKYRPNPNEQVSRSAPSRYRERYPRYERATRQLRTTPPQGRQFQRCCRFPTANFD
jgi:hypothetical protein